MSIVAKNIHKDFEDTKVLRGINLTIHDGEVVVIVGSSGSGKSTFLRCLNLLTTPTSGQIFIDDEDITEPGVDLNQIRRKVGMVFQNFNLFPHWTVLENITNPMIHVQKKDRMIAREKGRELLGRMGLADKEKEYPFALSGGQKQRVAIARALALEPKILFFDEPTSALDPRLTGEILALIRSLKDSRMAMVIVTHEMQFAREISDRILFLSEGEVLCVGSPEEVFSSGNERLQNFLGGYAQERI